jgi:multidrug efflux pump subunit AcrA (membrane-fusion protein)
MKPDLDTELEGLRILRTPQPEPKKRSAVTSLTIAAVVAIVAVTAIVSYLLHNRARVVQVTRVMAAQSPAGEDNAVVLNATGYIIAHHQIQVASKVSGKVAWIGVDEGSEVKKGEVLVRLENTE